MCIRDRPGIEPICDELKIPQSCLDDVAKKANAEYVKYSYRERRNISERIAGAAVNAYSARKSGRNNPMRDHGYPDAITGVTEVTLKDFLGGSFGPLIELIKPVSYTHLTYTGDVASVKSGTDAGEAIAKEKGLLVNSEVIPSPSELIVPSLL